MCHQPPGFVSAVMVRVKLNPCGGHWLRGVITTGKDVMVSRHFISILTTEWVGCISHSWWDAGETAVIYTL